MKTKSEYQRYCERPTILNGGMTREQVEAHKRAIDGMSQEDMCSLHRFAPSGHPYFDRHNQELVDYWTARFKELDGFTPEISKRIGW
jgi:hypothetical protein